MKYIINFIDWIISTVETLWGFVTSLIDNTLKLFKYLGVVANIAKNAIATMPSWLQTFAFITVFIAVLYMILGRDSGGKD